MLVLFFCSCEKQRFLNVPFSGTHYVINGLFAHQEPCLIEISHSQYLNDTSVVKNVSTAKVLLFEDNVLLEELNYVEPMPGVNLGSYTSGFVNFRKGKEYSIKVNVNADVSLSAQDVIPASGVQSLQFTGPSQSDSNTKDLVFELDVQQSGSQKKYYHILLQQRWVEYNFVQGDSNLFYLPWFNKAIFPQQNLNGFIPTPSEPFSLTAGGLLQGIMFDNQEFNGPTKRVRFTASNVYPQSVNSYLESRLVVRTVSENYFWYYFSSSQYYRTKGVPLTEPVIIHNNITNGLGNFAGYYSDTSVVERIFYQ